MVGPEALRYSSRIVANPSSASHLKAVFIGEISDYLDEVKQLGNAVEQRASVAEAQCIIPLYHKKALVRDLDFM